MNYSPQQLDIIETDGNMVINAIAGSGKTSTLAGYAARRKDKKILYLAFNNSVKQEAIQKFKALGLSHVRVETAHALALGYFRSSGFKIYKGNYQPFDVKQILGFQQKDAVADMRFGKHVLQMAAAFCNSTEQKVANLEYVSMHADADERTFISSKYDALVQETRRFLGMMQSGEIEMTHDFYLKMYQLAAPNLSAYHHILFDEGQDASPVMLDVFLNQHGEKVIVGDEHQQIYRWRYATNAMKKSGFPKKYLETSYRFDQHIGDLAKAVLATKSHLEESRTPNIIGKGQPVDNAVKATLGRTNGALLVDVIDQLVDMEKINTVYFEGHFMSYTYADEGGSVWDVLNLYLGNRKGIRNPMVKQFKDFQELQEYTDQSGDAPMKGILDIVMKYRKELPNMIQRIKDCHVEHEHKHEADMIYSTVHKAKGMEYAEVRLLEDFLGEERLLELLNRKDITVDPERLLEDINILYVALTRAQNKITLPQGLVPEDFETDDKPSINVLLPLLEGGYLDMPVNNSTVERLTLHETGIEKAYSYAEKRKVNPEAYKSWSEDDDDELELLFVEQNSVKDMAEILGRSKGAIRARIKKLELREKYFDVG